MKDEQNEKKKAKTDKKIPTQKTDGRKDIRTHKKNEKKKQPESVSYRTDARQSAGWTMNQINKTKQKIKPELETQRDTE